MQRKMLLVVILALSLTGCGIFKPKPTLPKNTMSDNLFITAAATDYYCHFKHWPHQMTLSAVLNHLPDEQQTYLRFLYDHAVPFEDENYTKVVFASNAYEGWLFTANKHSPKIQQYQTQDTVFMLNSHKQLVASNVKDFGKYWLTLLNKPNLKNSKPQTIHYQISMMHSAEQRCKVPLVIETGHLSYTCLPKFTVLAFEGEHHDSD